MLAATFAAVLIAPAPAFAHSTDDWVAVYGGVSGERTDGAATTSHIRVSRHPTRNLQARACHAGSDGAIIRCESAWH